MNKKKKIRYWKSFVVWLFILTVFTIMGSSKLIMAQQQLPKSIVVQTGGGVYAKAYKNIFSDPWTKKTGVEVILYTGEPAQALAKIRANLKNPPFDALLALPEPNIPDARKWGILDQMNLETVPNLKEIPPVFHDRLDNYAVSNNFVFINLLYNKTKVKNPPSSWQEMVERTIQGDFGKRISLPSLGYSFAYPFFWVIGHVFGDCDTEGNPPEGLEAMDNAFEKYKLMKPFIPKFWTTAVEAINLIEAGEVDIIAYFDHRSWTFVDQGHKDWDVIIPTPGTFEGATMAKVKGAHPIVFDFINFILEAENQSKWAATMSVHPVNSKARTSPIMQERFDRTTPKGNLIIAPSAKITHYKQKWLERWNREIGG